MRVNSELREAQFAEAATQLQQLFDYFRSLRVDTAILVADQLSFALEESGDSQRALQVLEATSGMKGWISIMGGSPGGPFGCEIRLGCPATIIAWAARPRRGKSTTSCGSCSQSQIPTIRFFAVWTQTKLGASDDIARH
jgi:hypothetical protein